jgi:hypothetical protein
MGVNFFPCSGCEAKIRSPRPLANNTLVRCPKCAVITRITEDMNASPRPARLTSVGGPATGRTATATAARAIPPARASAPLTSTLTKPMPVAKKPSASEGSIEVAEDQPKKKKKKPTARAHPAVQAALLVFALGGIGFGGYMIYSKLYPKDSETKEAPEPTTEVPTNIAPMPKGPPVGANAKGPGGNNPKAGKDRNKGNNQPKT